MRLKKKNLQIAIDGNVASGKSIAASRLAKKLGLLYVYTGAMYRAIALAGVRKGYDLKKEEPIVELLKETKIELKKPSKKNRVCDVFLNGEDVTDQLFTPRVHWGSSQVAVFPKVRKCLVEFQQEIARNQGVVMEGRDIATIVLPNADLKIFMTADVQIRAKRRFKELQKSDKDVSYDEVLEEIKKRDYQDSHRKINPLKKAEDAWVLDTSKLTIDEEIELILEKLRKRDLIE
jgi:cytidylate kinase